MRQVHANRGDDTVVFCFKGARVHVTETSSGDSWLHIEPLYDYKIIDGRIDRKGQHIPVTVDVHPMSDKRVNHIALRFSKQHDDAETAVKADMNPFGDGQ